MSYDEIKVKAEELRKEGIGMTNYTRIVNDVLVLIRELAERGAESYATEESPPLHRS